MKVSGFTFVKNAVTYGYPIVECIQSMLPLCDEVIVSIGDSNDDTEALINSIKSDKLKIFHSIWDKNLNEGGQVLAKETDNAYARVSSDSDWCIYLQADEVLHEADYSKIRAAMKNYQNLDFIEGLLLSYVHFYGSYNNIGISSNFYANEIRIIKNNPQIYSFRDAQGFRIRNNEKLRVRKINAKVFHYGWARSPKIMTKKYLNFNTFWYKSKTIDNSIKMGHDFNYAYKDYCVVPFEGEHPLVMDSRVSAQNWKFDDRLYRNRLSLKDQAKQLLRKYLGLDFNYRNYKIV